MAYSDISTNRRKLIIDRLRYALYRPYTCFNAGFDGDCEYSISNIGVLFYALLHAYAPSSAEMSELDITVENGEFRIKSDRPIYLNNEVSYIQALCDYFYVEHGTDSCEVICRPTDKAILDKKAQKEIEEIIQDYTFVHPYQVVQWNGKTYKHERGVGDLLQAFLPEAHVMYHSCLGGLHSISLAIALTKDDRHNVLSYVNGRRFPKCNIEELFKDAILKHIPEASNGFRAVMDIPKENLHFPLRMGYVIGEQFDLSEAQKKDIDLAVAGFITEEQRYGIITPKEEKNEPGT